VIAGVETAEQHKNVVKGETRTGEPRPNLGTAYLEEASDNWSIVLRLSSTHPTSAKNRRTAHCRRWVHSLRMVLVSDELCAQSPLYTERYETYRKPWAVRIGLKATGTTIVEILWR